MVFDLAHELTSITLRYIKLIDAEKRKNIHSLNLLFKRRCYFVIVVYYLIYVLRVGMQ
jgi:hypothetical protein